MLGGLVDRDGLIVSRVSPEQTASLAIPAVLIADAMQKRYRK